MAFCTVVPPHILRSIVQSSDVDDHTKQRYHTTLSRTAHMHTIRSENAHANANASRRNAGFVQPQVQHRLAEDEVQTESSGTHAQDTQSTDQKMRSARAMGIKAQTADAKASAQLRRTIYDAQHSFEEGNLPGDIVLIKEGDAAIPLSKDPSNDANECYQNFKWTYDFYRQIFNRNSIDNAGRKLIGSVHFGTKYQNAFWNGTQMVFGDGDQVIFTQFTGIRDVVGHELTHGVVEKTCGLDYEGQSGALNESLADVFGIMVRQWSEKQKPGQARWVIGEGILTKTVKGRGLRDMQNPGTAYDDPRLGKDPQPAHMKDYQDLPNTDDGDYGGVHINSGIPNRAFYLAATKIGGNSWEGAGQVWYKAMTDSNLSHDATFAQFAQITVNNAGPYAEQVTEAWKEVGVILNQDKGGDGEKPAEEL